MPMHPPSVRRVPLGALVVICVLLAITAGVGRRLWIRSFFEDGPERVAAAQLQRAAEPRAPLRVLLIDGLRLDHADTLAKLRGACDRGERLRVDVGFPTVSLPVQHVLWTGRSQQASGILYRIPRLEAPPADALPLALPGSRAVAESHVDIIHSFGFETAEPATEAEVDAEWREAGFETAARRAIASDAPLVFIHALRVDEAGHAGGAAAPAYAAAATAVDAMLDKWLAAAPEARWTILADHGHRNDGGHGGAEAQIRQVRACRFGPGIAPSTEPRALSLPELAAELRAEAGVTGPAITNPAPGPGPLRILGAALILLAGFGLTWRLRSGWASAWPLASAAVFVLAQGWPSLSMPAVYPPLGLVAAELGALGPLLLCVGVFRHGQREEDTLDRWLLQAMAPALALTLAAHVMAGSFGTVLEGAPPLTPWWTAWASLTTIWLASAAGAMALTLAIRGAISGFAVPTKAQAALSSHDLRL